MINKISKLNKKHFYWKTLRELDDELTCTSPTNDNWGSILHDVTRRMRDFYDEASNYVPDHVYRKYIKEFKDEAKEWEHDASPSSLNDSDKKKDLEILVDPKVIKSLTKT